MKAFINKPVNETQRVFNELCEKGGGPRGGPILQKVIDNLRTSGQRLNEFAFEEMASQIEALSGANPWHICFAFGVGWGHLAKLDIGFTEAAVSVLTHWNDGALNKARSYCLERGPRPIEELLRGALTLFNLVKLPDRLPSTLRLLSIAQERWFSPILNTETRPPYIGAWNACAMFMMALFAQPELAATQLGPPPSLPFGGPTYNGLMLLYQAGLIRRQPAGSELDDAGFEPGAIYENNALLEELCRQGNSWSMIDVHSGLYMLGTRTPLSDNWD